MPDPLDNDLTIINLRRSLADASRRTSAAADQLEADNAAPHLIAALRDADTRLREIQASALTALREAGLITDQED